MRVGTLMALFIAQKAVTHQRISLPDVRSMLMTSYSQYKLVMSGLWRSGY